MPSFAIFFEAACAATSTGWVEIETDTATDRADRNGVPDFAGRDAGREKVDIAWRVGTDMPVTSVPEGAHHGIARVIAAGTFYFDAQMRDRASSQTSKGSLSPMGFPTGNPRLAAWSMNSSSAGSPVCLDFPAPRRPRSADNFVVPIGR